MARKLASLTIENGESISRPNFHFDTATDLNTGRDMVRMIGAALGLGALWWLMSGLFTPLLLCLGVISVVIAVWVFERMDAADEGRLEFSFSLFRLAKYSLWLLVEIAKANWQVTKIILSSKMPIRQKLFNVKISQQSDIGQVVFANSITLTPGTITVETESDHFLVHAVAYNETDIDALAEMDRRVTEIESIPQQGLS